MNIKFSKDICPICKAQLLLLCIADDEERTHCQYCCPGESWRGYIFGLNEKTKELNWIILSYQNYDVEIWIHDIGEMEPFIRVFKNNNWRSIFESKQIPSLDFTNPQGVIDKIESLLIFS